MNTPSYFEHNARQAGRTEVAFDLVESDETIELPALTVEERELVGDEAQVIRAWIELRGRQS